MHTPGLNLKKLEERVEILQAILPSQGGKQSPSSLWVPVPGHLNWGPRKHPSPVGLDGIAGLGDGGVSVLDQVRLVKENSPPEDAVQRAVLATLCIVSTECPIAVKTKNKCQGSPRRPLPRNTPTS